MSWLETIRTGVNGVRTHRLRSFLTVLGILIGIAGVIIAVGLGEGASGQVTSEINSLGSNVLTITPGSSTSTSGIREALGSASTLTTADVSALASPIDAPDIKAVAGITSSSEVLTAGSETATTTVQGTTPSWLTVRGRTVAQGRFLDNQDVKDVGAVVVLGETTASELFSRGDPVGQTVDVNGVPLTVVGVLDIDRVFHVVVEHHGPRRHGDHSHHDRRRAHLRRHLAERRQLHCRAGPFVGRPARGLSGGGPSPPAVARHHQRS